MPKEPSARQESAFRWNASSTELRNDLWAMLDEVESQGDPLDRWLGPLAGLLISKWAANEEAEREAVATANDRGFASELPQALRLPSWEEPRSNHADAVAEALREVTGLEGARGAVVRHVGSIAPLIIRAAENPPSMFKRLLAWVRRLDLGTLQGRAVAGYLFDDVLFAALDKQGKRLGEFVTPAPAVDFMLELAKPEPGERIYDPCFGYGGVLIGAARRLCSNGGTSSIVDGVHARRQGVFGVEVNRFSFAVGICRALLAGVDRLDLELGDALERPLPGDHSSQGFDCILAVPPWGRRHTSQNATASSFPFPSRRYENLFLQHVMANLRPGGRAVVAVPDGVLFRSGRDHQVRKALLSDYRVDAVVSLPDGAFAPHTSIHVNLVLFRREDPASQVRFVVVSREAWEKVSLDDASDGGALRAGLPVSSRFCRNLAKVVSSGSLGSAFSGIKVWDVTVRELASRDHDLVAKESGTKALDRELDGLRKADPSLKIERLENVAETFRGRSFDRRYTTEDRTSPDVVAGLLRVGDLKREPLQAPSLFLTGEKKGRLKDEDVLGSGDLVLTTRGAIGKAGIIPGGFGAAVDSVATESMTVLRAGEAVKPEFLSAVLRSPVYKDWMAGDARGNTIQHLSIRSLRGLRVPVPSVPVQDAVLTEMSGPVHISMASHSFYFEETDAIAVLARVLSGAAKDPIAAWLAKPTVAALASRRQEEVTLYECLNRLGELLSSLPVSPPRDSLISRVWPAIQEAEPTPAAATPEAREALLLRRRAILAPLFDPLDLEPLISFALDEVWAAVRVLAAFGLVPDGPGRLVVLERARGHLGLALRHLQDAEAPYVGRLSQFIERMFDLAGQEIDAMRASVQIDIVVEPDAVPVGIDSEVQLRLTNSSTLPLVVLQVGTRPPVGARECPYLADGESCNIPLTVRPQDTTHPFPIAVSWAALRLDGTSVKGDEVVHLSVRSTRDAGRPAALGASPYIVGNPVDREEMFFGRTGIMDRIWRQLGEKSHANVILLEGNRRTGKTSILRQLGKAGVLPDWIPVYCSFQDAEGDDTSGGITTRNVFRLLARTMGWALYDAGVETWFPGLSDRDPARPFKLAFRTALTQAFAGEHPFETFELYIEAALQAARPRRVLLMLDEFDKLQEGIDAGITSPQVPENIRHLLQHQSGLSAIITGSRRLKRLREEYWSALFGFGHRIGVGALPVEDAQRLVAEPVEGRLDYLPQARDRIVKLCARHPFLIQSLCNRVFEHAASDGGRTITLGIVEQAATEMVEENEHFRTLWDYAGSARRRLLLELCDRLAEGSDPVNLDLLEMKLSENRVPFSEASDLADDIQELRELELIELNEGYSRRGYRLAVPLMAKWLRKNVDFEDLLVRCRQEAMET